MFRAGQASARRHWLWPVLTLLATGLAAMFAAALILQPGSRQASSQGPGNWTPKPPAINQSSVAPDDEMTGAADGEPAAGDGGDWLKPDTPYSHAQQNLLRWGLDGLPLAPALAAPPPPEKPAMLLRSF
jgi:hypothetical protein